MNILVIGSGGREHAIVKKLKADNSKNKIFALPGNDGMEGVNLVPLNPMNIDDVVKFSVENNIDFAIVTPDDPLAIGMVDALESKNIACFGPTKAAARLESSKLYAKQIMQKYNIPTGACKSFTSLEPALEYLHTQSLPIVVKADGLARGKGVIVANSYTEAEEAIKDMLGNHVFGASGDTVIIEEFLDGKEVSVLCLVDGERVIPMLSSMDHKRVFDNDEGPNTGGMGAIAPNPYYTKEIAEIAMRDIYMPTVKAMQAEGNPFHGCLFFGLMLTKEGPKVLEYNARFGDPETQTVLSLLKSDLLNAMINTRNGNLKEEDLVFDNGCACCVVMASKGYPGDYETGQKITVNNNINAQVFYAGVKKVDGELLTNGGRVLCITCTGENLNQAVENAYNQSKNIHFNGAHMRKDIGAVALNCGKE